MRAGGRSTDRITRVSTSSCLGRSGMKCDRSLKYPAATSPLFQVPPAIVTSEISLWADPLFDSSQKVLDRDAFEFR